MNILGIESTAHTFGVGIITDKGKVLANERDSYTSKDAGMILDEVTLHHQNVAEKVLKLALKESKLDWKDIDVISYSAGPGFGTRSRCTGTALGGASIEGAHRGVQQTGAQANFDKFGKC